MVETAFWTALFGALVLIFFTLLMCAAALALAGVGLLIGFVDHLWQNHKARKGGRG